MGSPLGFPVSNWVAGGGDGWAINLGSSFDKNFIVATQWRIWMGTDTGTVHILSAPEANGDYSFGYWESNGNRQLVRMGLHRRFYR